MNLWFQHTKTVCYRFLHQSLDPKLLFLLLPGQANLTWCQSPLQSLWLSHRGLLLSLWACQASFPPSDRSAGRSFRLECHCTSSSSGCLPLALHVGPCSSTSSPPWLPYLNRSPLSSSQQLIRFLASTWHVIFVCLHIVHLFYWTPRAGAMPALFTDV